MIPTHLKLLSVLVTLSLPQLTTINQTGSTYTSNVTANSERKPFVRLIPQMYVNFLNAKSVEDLML